MPSMTDQASNPTVEASGVAKKYLDQCQRSFLRRKICLKNELNISMQFISTVAIKQELSQKQTYLLAKRSPVLGLVSFRPNFRSQSSSHGKIFQIIGNFKKLKTRLILTILLIGSLIHTARWDTIFSHIYLLERQISLKFQRLCIKCGNMSFS